MKWLLYIAILLAVALLPETGTDVGKLIPVEVVVLSERNGVVSVHTDTGDTGKGGTLDAAIADMRSCASGIIYLDTAEYLLLEEGMESNLNTAERHLKDGTRLCYAADGISLEGIANFLSVHKPRVALKTVSESIQIQTITEENGRYRLVEK